MKILLKTSAYNFIMREQRAKLNLSQKELSILSGVNINDVQRIESLLPITSGGTTKTTTGTEKFEGAIEKLKKIAAALDIEFAAIFPDDYIDALKNNLLPKRSTAFFVYDMSLEQIPESHPDLLSPGPEDAPSINQDELACVMDEQLRSLRERERTVIELRYGITGQDPMTLQSIGNMMGISKAAVQNIEARALRKLRHPLRSKHLRAFLE